MSEPINLQAHKSIPDAEVIDLLEDMLARAKSGELRALIFIGDTNQGSYIKGWAGKWDDMYKCLGAATIFQHRIVALIEATTTPD